MIQKLELNARDRRLKALTHLEHRKRPTLVRRLLIGVQRERPTMEQYRSSEAFLARRMAFRVG